MAALKRGLPWIALSIAICATVAAIWMWRPAAVAAQRFVNPGPLSPGHAHLSDQCTACHEPTVGVTAAKCTPCHAGAERLLGRQPTQFHESVEECAACHLEHGRGDIRPVSMDHVALANIGMRTLARAADNDSTTTLQALRTWLHVDGVKDLGAASARVALNCASCHDRRDPHWKRFGSDCAQCHTLSSWRIASYRHPPGDSKQCVQCHQAPPSHYMEHFSMVSQKFAGRAASVEQCFACHNTTSWNDIYGVGFYKHH